MKTIILCGGQGTRLKEETEFKPKPMVLIGGKPVLWHIMKIYSHYGYNEFILALGYKAEYIKDYFLNQKAYTHDFTIDTATHQTTYHFDMSRNNDNFKITFVDTGLETLPGERILRCKDYIPEDEDEFMVTYGDGVSNINIKELVAFHSKHNRLATLTGIHPISKYGLIEAGSDGTVSSFIEKPLLSDWVNGGFMVFKKQAFEYFQSGETEHPALVRLAEKKQLSFYQHEDFWMSVDTYKELETLKSIWKEKKPWKIWT